MRLASTKLTLAVIAAATVGSLSVGCGMSQTSDVTVENEETVPLFSLFFDPVGDDTSTVNLIPNQQLAPGAQILLPMECGTYDIVVQVAGGDQPPGVGHCVITDEDVCTNHNTFVIAASNCSLGE
jgi:hypothetical protein